MLLVYLILLLIPQCVRCEEDGDYPTTTVIDLLSSDAEFSSLLLTIQRSGFIDLVNGLDNFTLLAPVNSAFDRPDSTRISLHQLNRYLISEPLLSGDVSGVVISVDSNASPIIFDHTSGQTMMVDKSTVVEPDLLAQSQDAVVQGVDMLLPELHNFCAALQMVYEGTQTVKFAKLLNRDCADLGNVTLMIPLDQAFSLDDVEVNYLLSDLGAEDRSLWLSSHILRGYVGGHLNNGSEFSNLLDDSVEVRSHKHGQLIEFDGRTTELANLPSYNALFHLFNESILPDLLDITPRKYLLGLNQSEFVRELDFRDLSGLIDDLSVNQTIFVYPSSDDNMAAMGVHKNNLMYQFVNETISLPTDKLVDSKFCGGKLGKNCQKIKISSFGRESTFLNNHVFVYPERYTVGNTTIYLIDDSLTLPPRLEVAISPFLGCSRSLKYLNEFGLMSLPDNKQGYTAFLPCYDSWKDIGLTLKYLEQNTTAMQMTLTNLLANGLVYSDFEGNKTLITVSGPEISIESRDHVFLLNNQTVKIEANSDILFSQGVVHAIDKLVLPSNLDIGLADLIDTVDSAIFKRVIEMTNMTHIYSSNHSLLLPTARSLSIDNITEYTDLDYLTKFVKLHVLPGDAIDKLMNCESRIPTLLNGTHLSCREISSNQYMLQIVEGLDHEVRVLQHGLTTNKVKSGLFVIDRPISPKWMEEKGGDGFIHIHLPAFAIAIGIIIGMITLLFVILCCLVLSAGKGSPEASGGDGDGDAEQQRQDTEPLLNEDSSAPYDSADSSDAFHETQYSRNASTRPIKVQNSIY